MHCIDEMAQFAIVFVPSSDSGSSTATFANLFFECHVGQEGKITEVIEELNPMTGQRHAHALQGKKQLLAAGIIHAIQPYISRCYRNYYRTCQF